MSAPSSTPTLQQAAYGALNSFFQAHKDDVLEIEILPPAFQPQNSLLLQDEQNLGVSKKVLALAYIEARQRFLGYTKDSNKDLEALHATRVMLLFDPEHITAANFRKRRLNALKDTYGCEYEGVFHTALRQELCFLNSILTSPLHRQSKSPCLWSHREWMIGSLLAIEFKSASEDQKAAFWRAEISAVCKSGERHPKNYYAWQYARRMMPRIGTPDTYDEFGYYIKDWCCKHPSDISGWTFLYHLINEFCSMQKRQDLSRDVIQYAISLRAEQESLWVFIRLALSQKAIIVDRLEFYQLLQRYSKNHSIDDKGYNNSFLECVARALRWIETYGEPIVLQ